MSDATYAALEKAIADHVADEFPHVPLVADWYLVATHLGEDPTETLYLDESSGAPPHVLLGLIEVGRSQIVRLLTPLD